ncbi:hypothetical protein R1flu_023383 [Riccia fluitans]|uniref:Caleosin n=1 Tax=Riccia fluitans TaxID=41844 RepID=A0ABD1XRY0_9MARC
MEARNGENDAVETVTARAPVTIERPVPTELKFDRPYMARALEAVDSEHPSGTVGYDNKGYSVLQQHVAFFDRNGDGVVYPSETYAGFRVLGFNPVTSFISAFAINAALSYTTLKGWFPNPLLPVYIDRIHKSKHGSDTGVYDTEGRFVPAKFEEIWTKYAKTRPDKMNKDDLSEMQKSLRVAFDPFGWLANKVEWNIAFTLGKDEEGFISKEVVRGIYDGSYFESVEKSRTNKKNKTLPE